MSSPDNIGKAGERRVARKLDWLPKEYIVLNDIMLPTQYGTTQIDHMIPRIKGAQIFQTILFAHAKRATVQKERRTSWNGITTSSPSLRSCFYVAISS